MKYRDAQNVIELAKQARGRCDECEISPQHRGEGWEQSATNLSWFRRCDACASTPLYPWADKLNVRAVILFEKANRDRVIGFEELEKLV